MHIRLRVAVLRDSARPRRFRSAGGGETNRAWHLGCSSRLRAASASLPLPTPPLPAPSRRFAPRCFVGRIQPPRLAACSAAHAPNRAAACRSARRSAALRRLLASDAVRPFRSFLRGSAFGYAAFPHGRTGGGRKSPRRPDASPMCVSACGASRSAASIWNVESAGTARSRRVLRGELAPVAGLARSQSEKRASARDWRAQEPRPERRKRARPLRQARARTKM